MGRKSFSQPPPLGYRIFPSPPIDLSRDNTEVEEPSGEGFQTRPTSLSSLRVFYYKFNESPPFLLLLLFMPNTAIIRTKSRVDEYRID